MTDREKEELKRQAEIVNGVNADFKRRQQERRAWERKWQLNLNFLRGYQYCGVNGLGEIEDDRGGYYWQERRVFNRIAPVVDARCCKLTAIRPRLTVRAASDDDADRRSAKIASAILSATCEDCEMDAQISAATMWSEVCGTAFYKVLWDSYAGSEIGKTFEGASVREGKVKIIAVSPFEIYPDTLSEEKLEEQPSIIHARAVPVSDIFTAYGVVVEGRDIDEYRGLNGGGTKHGYEVVIERYVRPNYHFPQGRLTIVAGDKLLFDGDLPYYNGEDGACGYPFAMQKCMPQAGCFFGDSVIERLLPVQRAYNAVKNRKHEFLNRIAAGVVAVEEGSVDTDELLEDGLVPGKVIVYRQGGTPPQMLTMGTVPSEFTQEEERLENEFAKISGINDFTQNANIFTGVTSATGLRLILEQDDAKLNVSYEQIKQAIKRAGKLVLRLYRQFASSVRLIRFSAGGDKLSAMSFMGSDILGDDVVLEADSDANTTPAQRRATVYDMLDKGLFSDDSGNIPPSVKARLLQTLGYNGLAADCDVEQLHLRRCENENTAFKEGGEAAVKDYDDHAVHIKGHTAFLLTEELTPEEEERVCVHLAQHKKKISEVKNEG